MTGVTAVSGATSNPGKSTTKAGVVIETMSAPNPVSPQKLGPGKETDPILTFYCLLCFFLISFRMEDTFFVNLSSI